MSRINNKIDKLISLINSKPGFIIDDREKLKLELEKLKNFVCCLPKCDDFCLEIQDIDGNVIDINKLDVCTPYVFDYSACLSIMQADFVSDVTIEDKDTPIQFTDLTNNNPTSWYWDFGDGNYSTDQNPVHQYDDYGLYTVTLMAAKDGAGDIEIKEDYIAITDPHAL